MKVDKLFIATKALIFYENRVLILRESTKYKDGTNAGKYDVVGGRMEPGQTYIESLLREIKEETGLEVKIGEPFFVQEWYPVVRNEQWQVVGIYFECTSDTNQVVLSEDHDSFEWIIPENYDEYNLTDEARKALEFFIELNV